MSDADRILTSHVGSLIRPPELVDFLLKQQDGKAYDAAAFEALLRESVDNVVRQQAEIGIDIVSDGEYGKPFGWSRYILHRLSGFEERPAPPTTSGSLAATAGKDRRDFADFYREYEEANGMVGMGKQYRRQGQWTITGPVRYSGQAAIKGDIEHFKTALAKVEGVQGFMPVVAPGSVAPERKDEYYKSEEEGLFAIAGALGEEYKAIIDAGLTVQIDDAFLATWYDVMVPPATLAEYRKWAQVRIDALNHAIKGLPVERIRYHVCWGSWNGPHTNDVGARDIIDLVLKLNVGGISLEMANPRHEHEWRVWETVKLPEGKKLLPGVVSHCTNVVEHPELVAERITRLAKLVGRDNVIGSTDCGFAQGPFTRRTHPSIMWAKLKSLAEGARLASKALWGRKAA
jgi:5-methyltetrahydropteroyltriglutamate--homocysteine methyltransferase